MLLGHALRRAVARPCLPLESQGNSFVPVSAGQFIKVVKVIDTTTLSLLEVFL